MGVDALAAAVEPPPHTAAQIGSGLWYTMYGRCVRSDFHLPMPWTLPAVQAAPDWSFRRAPRASRPPTPDGPVVEEVRCHAPCHAGEVVATVRRGPGGAWFSHVRIGTIHVHPDGRLAEVYPTIDCDERMLGLMLAGPISVFILHQLGQPTLHASAVVTDLGAVAFFGRKGRGKSTMVSCFLRRGAALLTDDVLSVRVGDDATWATPSLPIMKLWRDSVERALELSDELPDLAAGIDKKLLRLHGRYQFAQQPARLSALYVLDRYDPAQVGGVGISTRQLRGLEAVAALLGQVSYGAFLSPSEAARFLPFYARVVDRTPVRVLSYPHGFEHQESVYRSILAELEKALT